MSSTTPPAITPTDAPRVVTVAAVMTPAPVAIHASADLWEAMRTLLASGLRHLIVEDADGRCCGVLADRYVVGEWPADAIGLRVTLVEHLIGDPAPMLARTTTVAAAARTMLDARTDALAVVDADGRAVGIVTGSDLVRALAAQGS